MGNKKIDYSNKTIYKNSFLSMIYKFAGSGLSLISAPLLLHCLGEEKYGIWTTMLSFISWIYYMDLGIGSGLRNKLAASLSLEDEETSKKYIAVSYTVISLLSLIVFVIAYIAINFFDIASFFNLSIENENVNLCLTVAIGIACINFVISLANNILYALQRASLVSLFGIVAQLFFIGFLAIYRLTGNQMIFYVAIGEGCSQLLKNIVETIYVFVKNKNLKFSKKDIDFSYSKSILSFGVLAFFTQIAALVLNSTDNLLITKYFGAANVTPYSFCYKFFSLINSVYVVLITPLLSGYTAAYARKDKEWIMSSLKKNILLYLLFVFGSIVAAIIFKPFCKIWLQKDLAFDNGLIICTTIYFIILMFSHIWSTFLTGIGEIKRTTYGNIVATIVNIPASIILAINFNFGVNGIILGSVISQIIGLLFVPHIVTKKVKEIKQF